MRIGFAKTEITPPPGTELGGYAGHRPCIGVHDPLWCKAVVLEQNGVRYALLALDLLCVDEALYMRIGRELEKLDIWQKRLIVCAIHTHAAPRGVIPGEGPLAAVNRSSDPKDPAFPDYIHWVVEQTVSACAQAVRGLEPFLLRSTRGPVPAVGSERHTGAETNSKLTVVQFRTKSGRTLTIYNFPCHPTVMSAANLQVSADFTAGIEQALGCDMALFLNGAAGDVSTRFTRRESSFDECTRMGRVAAKAVLTLLEGVPFHKPEPIRGLHSVVTVKARQVETPEAAEKRLAELTQQWQHSQAAGADAATVRTLKSYAEGAGLNLQFAKTMGDIHALHLPVSVFRFAGLDFATIPGELFSALQPEALSIIGYANGYYRYLGGEEAYEAGYYEALAAIVARGESEKLVKEIIQMQQQL